MSWTGSTYGPGNDEQARTSAAKHRSPRGKAALGGWLGGIGLSLLHGRRRQAKLNLDEAALALGETRKCRKSNGVLYEFIRQNPFAVALLDRQMRYLLANDKWLSDNRLTGESVQGRSHYDLFPEIPESWKEIHQRCLAGATEQSREEAFRRQDGAVDWIRWKVCPWYDEQGKVGGLIIFSEDISARKTAEDQLKQSYKLIQEHKRRTDEIIRNAGATLWAIDKSGIVTFVEGASVQSLGIDAEKERLGRNVFEIIGNHPDLVQAMQQALAGKRSRLEVYRYSHWFEVTFTPVLDEAGQVSGVVGTSIDVSTRKRAQDELKALNHELDARVRERTAALAAAEFKYRSLIEAAHDSILTVDGRGKITMVNPQLERFFGYEKDELVGQDLETLMPDRLRQSHAALRSTYMDHAYPRSMGSGLEIFGRRKDGTEVPIDISLSPFKTPEGVLVTAIIRDISVTRKLASERQRLLEQEQIARSEAEDAKAEAVRANKVKDAFLATLSHELRTPLTAILGWTQELQGKGITAEVKTGLAVIERNAQAQGQLIEDLLDVSRIQAGKMSLNLIVTDLVTVLENAVATARFLASKRALQITVNLPKAGCPVSGDPARLQQVFLNLLTNAVKFTPHGGQIFVGLTLVDGPLGKLAQIQIRDTGIGIKAEFIGQIFERFNQIDASLTRASGGLGLGLAIAKSLIEMQRGTIEAASQGEGQGTSFTIRLPLAASGAASVRQRQKADYRKHTLARLDGLKVLVVDDSPDNLLLFSVMLRSLGAEVRAAASAGEGLKAIADFKPDLLLSDISMPGEDGYALIRKVRALDADKGGQLPAIALTAYAGADDVRSVMSAGFSMHVAKPVEKAALSNIIAKFTRSSRRLSGYLH